MRVARLFAGPSTPDRHTLTRLPGGLGGGLDFDPLRVSVNGRTQTHPQIVSGEKTLVIIAAGQSNICNSETGSTGDETNQYVCTSPKVENLSIYNGGVYRAIVPLLGCSTGIAALSNSRTGGNWLMRLGDKLITAGVCARVILVPIGASGTSSGSWASHANQCFPRVAVAASRLASVGLTADAILWQQGESDHGTSSGDYQTIINALVAEFRTRGVSAPFFVAQGTRLAGVNDATIRAAQAALVNHGSGIWAGPDTDTLTLAGGKRQVDDTHFNAAGANDAADLWKAALALYGAPFV